MCDSLVLSILCFVYGKVGDFAILLRAGFDRWSAARMQFYTALGGVLGACFALGAQSQQGAGEQGQVLQQNEHNYSVNSNIMVIIINK